VTPSVRAFSQVDVFTATPCLGNPVAVVHDADDLTDDQMAAFARWTNLSETTFLLKPSHPDADYRLRIFTTAEELPFAGHPTLGTCHAWLEAGGRPAAADGSTVVQECGVGLVTLRRSPEGLAFAAPPLRTDQALDDATLRALVSALGVPTGAVVDHRVLNNGPTWVGVLLDSAERVLELSPDWPRTPLPWIGVVGAYEAGDPADFEVRAFVPGWGGVEDPVTGSLNAALAQWLIGTGRAPDSYVASQGTVIGRRGRVRIAREVDADRGDRIWVGGATVTCISGTVII
jgi:PhzF family phenazine biosynthesis protein